MTTVPDRPQPLCTWAQFTSGAFADLARNYQDASAQADILAEATRLCERSVDRRLAPFVGHTETATAYGINPDEYPAGGLPTSQQAALGQSYTDALGGDTGVRRFWIREFAPAYPELWTYSSMSVQVATTYGGQSSSPTTINSMPDVDTGQLWVSLGTWIPVGSMMRFVYSGGYTVSVPADLVRAGKLMTASILLRELQPSKVTRDPEALHDAAIGIVVSGYPRDAG